MGWKKRKVGKVLQMEPKQKKKDRETVMVCLPVESGGDGVGMGVHRFIWMLHELNHDPEFPITFTVSHTVDKKPVEWARNLLVGIFLQSDASRLWFIDNDMVPNQDALRMLHSDADITAALALGFDHANEAKKLPNRLKPCLFKHNDEEESFNCIVPVTGAQEVEVDAVGTATMLIKRRVLEDRRLWGPVEYENLKGEIVSLDDERGDPEWGPPIFRFLRKPNGQGLRGEDIDFSWRAKQLGYRVTGFPMIRVGHQKILNLDSILDLVNHTANKYGEHLLKQTQSNGGSDADQSALDKG